MRAAKAKGSDEARRSRGPRTPLDRLVRVKVGREMEINWQELRRAATEAAQRAYAPYSGLKVGAAAITSSGAIVTGCNVENASYGLTLCAECGLVSALHDRAAGSLVAVSIVDASGAALAPCGRCRQLLFEAGEKELVVDTGQGPRPIGELLPDAFGPAALEERGNR